MLRGLENLRNSATVEEQQSNLKKLEAYSQKQSEGDNLKIDTLIREETISPEMATSLLNDSDNVTAIIQHLLSISRLIGKG